MASFEGKTISHIHHELHSHLPSEPALRTKALESLLAEKQLIDPAAVDAWIEMYRDEIGPKRGAAVVARAWSDPAFKARLLADGTAAIGELGFAGHATGHLAGCREHGGRSQSRRLHALLLLSVLAARSLALLVQVERISRSRGARSAWRARGIRRRARRHDAGPGLGFDLGAALSRGAAAAGRRRRLGRGGARQARHTQFDDRRGARSLSGAGDMPDGRRSRSWRARGFRPDRRQGTTTR